MDARYNPGDRLRAETVNQLIEAILKSGGELPQNLAANADQWVSVKTTDTIPPYSVAILGDTQVGELTIPVKKPGDAGVDGLVFITQDNPVSDRGLMLRPNPHGIYKLQCASGVAFAAKVGPVDGSWAVSNESSVSMFTCVYKDPEATHGYFITIPPPSGHTRIRFIILSTHFTVGLGALGCDRVVAQVTHVSCGGTGVSVGDEVDVYDPENCHFRLAPELLVLLSGSATQMNSENYQPGMEDILSCVSDIRRKGCMFMLDYLCCAEEEILDA